MIRAEIDKRLTQARTSDPAVKQRQRLELGLAKATTTITRMIQAYSEQLITIDELRARMPGLRAQETNARNQIQAIDTHLADTDAYLKLADDLDSFLTQLRGNAKTAKVVEQQRVLRLLVKNVLIGPEKITIQHSIPPRPHPSEPTTDTEGDHPAHCPLRRGRDRRTLGCSPGPAVARFRRAEPVELVTTS